MLIYCVTDIIRKASYCLLLINIYLSLVSLQQSRGSTMNHVHNGSISSLLGDLKAKWAKL